MNLKPENLHQWTALQLEAEVAYLLEDPRYIIMNRIERVDNALPASRQQMIDFIFIHSKGLYKKEPK
jgi:hypothetical protein